MIGWLIGICLALVLGVLASMLYDSRRFVLKQYKLPCRNLKEECHFVMLSDLHNKSFGAHNEKLLRAIERISPEGILIAGDMLTAQPVLSSETDNRMTSDAALELVRKLAEQYPVYYANGNHEYRLKTEPDRYEGDFAAYRRQLAEAGVTFLENDHVDLPVKGLRIYGVEIDKEYYRKFRIKPMEAQVLDSLIGKPEMGMCSLLLAHNPDYFRTYAEWGADVVLSGHVHGGIMRLPVIGGVIAPSYRLFPRYDGGLFREGKSRMILGRGLGSHTIPIRVFNPGELIEITLVPEKMKSE